MTAEILFHPSLKVIDAARIAHGLGGSLVWRCGQVRIRAAMRHTDRAADAVEVEDYEAVLRHLHAARAAIFGGVSHDQR